MSDKEKTELANHSIINNASLKNFHKKLRNKVLNGADAVTVTSEKLKVLFDSISKDNFKISNGFDYNNSGRVLDVKFTISHIGSIYPDRNPELLWQVLEKLCLDIKDFKKDLKSFSTVNKNENKVIRIKTK